MAEEFTIKSETLEDKINQLLPSQGGYATGLDLSASSMIVPIVDLTESAEGSNIRQDLQTALSKTSTTVITISIKYCVPCNLYMVTSISINFITTTITIIIIIYITIATTIINIITIIVIFVSIHSSVVQYERER